MKEPHERLMWIRRQRQFQSATDAARAYGWNANTYRSHENDSRPLSKGAAGRYAKAFKVPVGWLLYGEGDPGMPLTAPLIGYVGAGSRIYFFNGEGDHIDDVELPPGGSAKTVAVEVRGGSMSGIANDRWHVYYEDVRDPPTDDLLGKLCVLQLSDGNILIKTLQRGRLNGHFDLWSATEPPMIDQQIAWAAKVTWIKPK